MSIQGQSSRKSPFSGLILEPGWIRFIFFSLFALIAVRIAAMRYYPIIDRSEGRYAEIARKMMDSGDWVMQQFAAGVPFWGKPPLYSWLSAGGMQVMGVNAFGARVFLFLLTMLLLVLFFLWIARNLDRATALVASTVLASTVLFIGSAGFVSTEAPLVFAVSLSLMAFWDATRSAQRSYASGLWFFAGLGIGMLAKGPVAIVLVGIPLFLWLLIGNRWRLLARLPWFSGILLFLVIATPWYVLAELQTPGFLRYFFIGEHIERFLISGWDGDLYGGGRSEPRGTIWLFAALMFLPWTLALAFLLFRLRASVRAMREDREGLRSYLLLWGLSPMLLFTLAGNILPAYVLPGLPGLALLLVLLWTDVFGNRPSRVTRIGFVASVWFTVVILAGLTTAFLIKPTSWVFGTQDSVLTSKVVAQFPDARLTFVGGRSTSAEFYSQGQAGYIYNLEPIAAWLDDEQEDVIALPANQREAFESRFGPQFALTDEIGQFLVYREIGDEAP